MRTWNVMTLLKRASAAKSEITAFLLSGNFSDTDLTRLLCKTQFTNEDSLKVKGGDYAFF